MYSAATRNGFRIAVNVGTGLVAAGSIVATGAMAAVAENETAHRQWLNEHKDVAVNAAPVIVRAVDPPSRTTTRYVTKPGSGGRLTSVPSTPTTTQVRQPTIRVVKTTKSSGS